MYIVPVLPREKKKRGRSKKTREADQHDGHNDDDDGRDYGYEEVDSDDECETFSNLCQVKSETVAETSESLSEYDSATPTTNVEEVDDVSTEASGEYDLENSKEEAHRRKIQETTRNSKHGNPNCVNGKRRQRRPRNRYPKSDTEKATTTKTKHGMAQF